MRKLIYAINVTLDGCCDHTKGVGSDDIHEYFANLLREVDTLVYGRKTYDLMVPFWPDIAKSDAETNATMKDFADAFVSVKNIVVFSRSMNKDIAPNTTVIDSDLKAAIQKLKDEPGKDLLLGGVDLPSQLMQLDLIDEYRLVVQPVIAGKGRRLFDSTDLAEQLSLQLIESTPFNSGSVALRYIRSKNNG